MQLPFATGAFSRSYGTQSSLLVNLMAEKAPLGAGPDTRLPRPGLVSSTTLGSGPIRGLFYNKGFFAGRLLQVSAAEAYLSDGTDLGAVAGSDLVRFDCSPTQLVAVSSGVAYLSTSGGNFAPITDTDLPPPVDVCYFGGYFVYPVKGSTRFYYSEVNVADAVDGLNFASVETTGDPIIGVAVLGDEMVFFKTTDIEFWSLTGNADNPFQKSPGVRYMRGCASRDTIKSLDNALFWVGDNKVVYRSGPVPQRVSDHGIEDKLRQVASISSLYAWTAEFEGHAFYVLGIPGVGTWAYDVSVPEWAEWRSYGQTGFCGQVSALVDGTNYVGDRSLHTVWVLTQGVHLDGASPLLREVSTFLPVEQGRPRCDNVVLNCVRGVGLSTGQGSSPLVEMRYSDDQGRTWNDWLQRSLGAQGQYKRKAVWRQLGRLQSPGRLFHFRCSDPVFAVFHSMGVNEDRP